MLPEDIVRLIIKTIMKLSWVMVKYRRFPSASQVAYFFNVLIFLNEIKLPISQRTLVEEK